MASAAPTTLGESRRHLHLTLRKKNLLIIGVTVLGLLGIVYYVSRAVLLRSFAALEEQNARADLARAANALSDDLAALDVTTRDYAAWDQTYEFVHGGRPNYGNSEFPDETFPRLRINVVMVLDISDKILFSKVYDFALGEAVPLPADLRERLLPGSPLLRHPDPESKKLGILLLPHGPMLIDSRPVLTSAGKGPIAGKVIMGRSLDANEVKHLAQVTYLSLTMRRYGDPQGPADFQAARAALSAQSPDLIRPLSAQSIAAYRLLQDLDGKPALILKVEQPRDIYQQGQASLLQLLLALLLGGLVYGGVALYLIEKVVVSRVTNLSRSVARIGTSGDLSARVSPLGRDELADLAGEINQMLEALQRFQEERHAREARLRLLVEQMPAILWTTDTDLRLSSALGAGLAALNLGKNELAGTSLFDFFQTQDPNFAAIAAHRRALHGESTTYELIWKERTFHAHVEPLRSADGAITGSIATALDITELMRAEEALRVSERRYRTLVENALICIHEIDLNGRILSMNPAGLRMMGASHENQVCGLAYLDIVSPQDRARVADLLAKAFEGEPAEFEFLSAGDSGARVFASSFIPIKASDGSALKVMGVTQDVTEQRQLEEQLRKAQKMEAVGRLAGGVAHDFNNLLMVIQGQTELLLGRLSPGDWHHEKVDQIRRAAERCSRLTRQLLAFSRMQVLQPKVLDLNTVVAEMGTMLPRLIGADIELTIVPGPRLGEVKADHSQIEQVILNLAVNARDAMPQGGKLIIETANVHLEESYARQHAGVRPGRYVMLAVSDTGTGMDAETQAHIFEPFFTTKELGKGTGLGLATVYGVLKQSGGWIWVYSEVGRGTTFKIYLPRVEVAEAAEPTAIGRTPPARPQGSETILLVEDQEGVRSLVCEFLMDSGYTVLEAKDGVEALELASRHEGPIHLLVTDMVMPKMGGPELASRLTALRPQMKVLYMSGYAEYAGTQQGPLESGAASLQKPFALDTLARKVREVIEGAPGVPVSQVQQSHS